MQLPQGIIGWTVFAAGLLVIASRVHGIDSPRAWMEWLERRFTYGMKMRYLGGILLVGAGILGYFGGFSNSILGWLFVISLSGIGLLGFFMLIFQNHLRHAVIASAEGSDKMLRIISILVVLAGLGMALAPFFVQK